MIPSSGGVSPQVTKENSSLQAVEDSYSPSYKGETEAFGDERLLFRKSTFALAGITCLVIFQFNLELYDSQ